MRPQFASYVGKRLKVVLVDGRQIHGTLLAFDKHMNLVVDEAQEFRRTKKGAEEERTLGLIMLRGETVVTTILLGDASTTGEIAEARLMETA